MTRRSVVLESVPLKGERNFKPYPVRKRGSWNLLTGFFSKFPDEHPRPFYMGVPPDANMQVNMNNVKTSKSELQIQNVSKNQRVWFTQAIFDDNADTDHFDSVNR